MSVPRRRAGRSERPWGREPPVECPWPDRSAAASRVDVQRELVDRARRGDHEAFAALVHPVLPRLDAVARLILHGPDRGEDAVQDALVRAWRALPTLRDADRFDAWLHRLLVRSCMDEARRSPRHRTSITWSPA